MTDYRYSIDDDGIICRAEAVRYGDDDTWRNYWDGDQMIAFIDGYRDGLFAVTDNDVSDLTSRVMDAFKRSGRSMSLLKRMAVVLADGNPDADFVCVGLDRGSDLYAFSWNGDADNVWRDEIEAVYHHEVYRIDVEQQITTVDGSGPVWLWDDSDCTEYYGEDSVAAEIAKQFPLTEYPAEQMVSSDG